MSRDPLVLVVDDYPDGLDLVIDVLEIHGLRAARAEDGPDALEQARRLLPDLVIMDAALPGIDGWEVTRRLKRDGNTSRIPVLMLTAHMLPEHAAAARHAGCDGFITKPILPEQLIVEVRRLLETRRRESVDAAE